MKKRCVFCSALAACFLLPGISAAETMFPLTRYPSASADCIAFVAQDQLWVVDRRGGMAKELTHGDLQVLMPRFSPDGRWLAFTGRSRGGQDVYVLPASGGEPQQLTFEAAASRQGALVLTWTPDSQSIAFLSQRMAWNSKIFQAFLVPRTGGLPQRLPLDSAGLMSYEPGGKTIAYNRIFRNFDSRKRYVGGQAQDIYTYNFQTKRLHRITDWKGTDTAPMWFGRKIYFLSDRSPDWRVNLWAYDLHSKQFHQVTHFTDYDIDFPCLGGGAITFQQGGRLYEVSLPSEVLREVQVEFPDGALNTNPQIQKVGTETKVTDIAHQPDFALSPQGTEALFSAHGDIFRAAAEGGSIRNLTATSNAGEDHPAWSPDGATIAYISDRTGEQQVVLRSAAAGTERVITRFTSGYLYTPAWSPDGQKLAVADANHALWLITPGGACKLIARDAYAEIHDASFSPDSRWLAYSALRPTQQRAIHLYELSSGRDTVVSSRMESDRLPVFSPDGQLLYFVSQRREQPFVSDRDRETNIASLKSDGLYVATLVNAAPDPLTPQHAAAPAQGASLHMDLEGLMSRAVAIPISPAEISSLTVRGRQLFYQADAAELLDGAPFGGEQSALRVFNMETRKDRLIATGLEAYSLSADGSKALLKNANGWRITDTRDSSDGPKPLDLSRMEARIDPKQEWAAMFNAAWRLDRDLYFDPRMDGDDWKRVHDVYAKLLPRLGSHSDFMYLLGELQGELASSHTFLLSAANDAQPPVRTALLGADYSFDEVTGRYRFARIYHGDNTRPAYRSPLITPGVGISEGDYLLAVNGRKLKGAVDPLSVFGGLHGPITLTVSPTADGPTRDALVEPVESEMALRQQDWIDHTRATVDRLSSGRIGYIFLSDFFEMGSEDFLRQFYPQLDKQGFIFDVRWNRGGFTSQFVLSVLRRKLAGQFIDREGGITTLPGAVAQGPMVTLTNHFSASDGDQFPFYFREYGLGQVIGTRTWGGVRGIKGLWPLLDGSAVTIPKDALFDTNGQWILENVGDEPDVTVESDPDEVRTGKDAQLEPGVRALLEQLKIHAPKPVSVPPETTVYPAQGIVPPSSFGHP